MADDSTAPAHRPARDGTYLVVVADPERGTQDAYGPFPGGVADAEAAHHRRVLADRGHAHAVVRLARFHPHVPRPRTPRR